MNALLKGKREWEIWNEWQNGQCAVLADFASVLLKKALMAILMGISFLLFVIYHGGRLLFWVLAASLQGNRPRLEKSSGEFVDISEEYSELYTRSIQNPFLRK